MNYMKVVFTLLRSLFYAICFLGLFALIALFLRRYDASIGIPIPAWLEIPGLIILLLGGLLGFSCIFSFVFHGKGTPAIFDPPTEFVPMGPYKYSRNPMYIGGLTMLMGLALYQHSISILLFFVFLCIVIQPFVIYYEEPGLRNRFGQSYREYCNKTPRWVPHFK